MTKRTSAFSPQSGSRPASQTASRHLSPLGAATRTSATALLCIMSFADADERPAKKRRFFVEESPIADRTLNPEPSLPDEIDALPETVPDIETPRWDPDDGDEAHPGEHNAQDGDAAGGFDTELFASVVGEELPASTIQRLRELSGNDMQRGGYSKLVE